ncbi:sulfate ABC transporter ATP-binding protein [Rhodobacteraceae bacterium 2376]|uniref:Sulfate ABC transporter ATP-binding protein n=1 Tax=Rhabdonatronobacter sediminivivens TaxID=2743469 RepID=A0A7Z0I2I5_9RHOB|nr:sulfate ABC transporter ATP-binding protein [Rhabdonatronobacter sediminivivens]NYS26772.1 sulfate ABC transporter ATP-binding protein [Rhabdonatronobacter sediminivivens]
MSISISGLTKQFGQTDVLRGIDLGVEKGELVALLGPSGSGKTTLLKIIAGLEWPDAGRLVVDGADWLQLAAQDRRIGFVFQHYALFPHMSVRDNLAFGLTVRPRSERPGKAVIAAKVEELLHFLQIAHLADRYPTQLSGGQRQRVALGRALAIEPKVLLLDEPFGALDAAIRRDLRRWLRGVHEATGSTTIFVTHDQEEAFELADRVVVMGEGRIEQIGHADAIHDHPATQFVARFMGATVELPVTLQAGRAEGKGLDLTALPRRALPDGAATLFVRPEDIMPVPTTSSPWRIATRTSNGAHLRLILRHEDGKEAEADVPRRAVQAQTLIADTPVQLKIEAGTLFATASTPARRSARPASPTVSSPQKQETSS